MTTADPVPRRLVDISAKAWEHPADRAATAALHAVPGLDALVRRLIEFGYERAFRQMLLAGSVRLGPDQLADVWKTYEVALVALDIPDVYDLYVTQYPFANAAAVGSKKPMVVLNSQTVTLLDRDELGTVLAHELGHVLSDHLLYRTALLLLLNLSLSARLPVGAGLPLMAVRSALLEWSRAAELSCDRAAALASRDPLLTCRTLMVITGGAESRRLNLDAFLRQASEYEEWESDWDKISRFFRELSQTHSYPVRRASELMKWVRAGEFDRIVGGDYPRRGDPVDARAHVDEAVRHYRDRFATIFREAGETLSSVEKKLSDWLGSRDESG